MKKISFLSASLLFFLSCTDKGNEQGIISGKAVLVTDEAFYHLITSEQEIFNSFYKEADIRIKVSPQEEAIEKFLKGDAEIILVSRDLTAEERKYLQSENIHPEAFKIAWDALVLITSYYNKDTALTLSSLKKRKLVADHANSAGVIFLADLFAEKDSLRIVTTGSMDKVAEYVLSEQDAVGLVSLDVYKSRYSKQKEIKPLAVITENGEYSQPFQEDLALDLYPLKRPVYLINRYKSGLGTGFASYILSENGQRVVLKSGLLPADMPGREVIIKKEF